MASSLNYVNYLNIVGYIINIFVTFGAQSIFNLENIGTISEKYQSIVSPAGFVFTIWGAIFLSQGLFTFAQAAPDSSSIDLIQKGVKYWYFIACLAQSGWVFAFGYEQIILSTVFMGVLLTSLVRIVVVQSSLPNAEYFWLFEFPFSLHCGWIFAAFAVNVNLAIVFSGYDSNVQKICAISTLAYVVVVAGCFLFLLRRPNYTIATVLAWACLGISTELRAPIQSVRDTFSTETISLVRNATIYISLLLLGTTIGYAIFKTIRAKRKEVNDDATSTGTMPV